MDQKIWLSNVSLEDAEEIMAAFAGVSIGLPKAAGGVSAKMLCRNRIAGLYATEERAKELSHMSWTGGQNG